MAEADIIIRGGELAGLPAADTATARILLLDQRGEQSLAGQARWSLGGCILSGCAAGSSA